MNTRFSQRERARARAMFSWSYDATENSTIAYNDVTLHYDADNMSIECSPDDAHAFFGADPAAAGLLGHGPRGDMAIKILNGDVRIEMFCGDAGGSCDFVTTLSGEDAVLSLYTVLAEIREHLENEVEDE